MRTYETPEEAARDGLRQEDVRVVGVATRGDEAVVAQVMNADGYPAAYEVETVHCFRDGDRWVGGNSGNHNLVLIQTSPERGTVVWWVEAKEGASAARVRLGEQEQTVAAEEGFIFVVFDDVPYGERRPFREVFPPLTEGARAYVRGVKMTSEENRARMRDIRGFDAPEVVEWLIAAEERA